MKSHDLNASARTAPTTTISNATALTARASATLNQLRALMSRQRRCDTHFAPLHTATLPLQKTNEIHLQKHIHIETSTCVHTTAKPSLETTKLVRQEHIDAKQSTSLHKIMKSNVCRTATNDLTFKSHPKEENYPANVSELL